MPRPTPRPPGPSGRVRGLLLAALACALLAAGCGSNGAATGGHDSPQDAAQGFLGALGAYDGTPDSLQHLLEWVPPSKRDSAQQSFRELGASGTTTRFKLEDVSVGDATVDGDTATVSVRAKLSICVSGTVGTQSYSTCPPAPVSPTGSFDTLTCVREQGQWYVADYAASGTQQGTPAPPSPDVGGVSPAPSASAAGGAATGVSTTASAAST